MDVALFMTVGTGIGPNKEEKIKSLAHGLLSAVIHYDPDKIVFFGSETSKDTVDSLKSQYLEERTKELVEHEFVVIDAIDDFDDCFGAMKAKIEAHDGYEVVIDYTSGTKTMTMSAAICSMLYHKRLSLVAGKRGKTGIVIPGTEKIVEQSLYAAYDKFLFDRVKNLFNSYRFGEAKTILSQIIVFDEKEKYEELILAYDLWDKFDHKAAFERLKEVRDERISQNKGFLGRLNHAEQNTMTFILADLLNNASRRIEEGKYDDAVARLYRTIELIAQVKLLDYDLDDLSDKKFTMDDLKEKKIDLSKYETYADDKGRLKLGLEKKFELLKDLGWEEADRIYFENKRLKDLLKKRNSSILAHGLEPVEKETAEGLFNEVKEYARIILQNIDELMECARFPEL